MLLLTELKSDPTTNSVQEVSSLVKCGLFFFPPQLQVGHSGRDDSQGIKLFEMKHSFCVFYAGAAMVGCHFWEGPIEVLL